MSFSFTLAGKVLLEVLDEFDPQLTEAEIAAKVGLLALEAGKKVEAALLADLEKVVATHLPHLTSAVFSGTHTVVTDLVTDLVTEAKKVKGEACKACEEIAHEANVAVSEVRDALHLEHPATQPAAGTVATDPAAPTPAAPAEAPVVETVDANGQPVAVNPTSTDGLVAAPPA